MLFTLSFRQCEKYLLLHITFDDNMADFGQQCINNLKSFYENQTNTEIKFMFFLASDLSKPKIKDVFKRWTIGKNTYFLIKGLQTGRNAWYVHIYEESRLKYFVKITKPYSNSLYDVKIIHTKADSDVNHGDHVTFGITRQKLPSNALVLTHWTEYIDDSGDFNFRREASQCNFIVNEKNIHSLLDDPSSFKNKRCERTPGTMESNYTSNQLQLLYNLSRIATGIQAGGGCVAKEKRKYHTCKGKRYLIRKGMNCRYINRGYNKIIVQKGGEYNGVTFMSDVFIKFMVEHLIKKVQKTKPFLEAVQIIYDEFNELGDDANDYIVIVYEFEQSRTVFYLKAQDAFVSCYVETKTHEDPMFAINPEERQIYDVFKHNMSLIVDSVDA